jgi:toxin ParE1/3/4
LESVEFDVKLVRRAERQLERIHRYIARDSVRNADRILLEIAAELARLSRFPSAGRAGEIQGTRELVISGTSYVAVYRVTGRVVDVLGIFHGAQRRPDSLN